MGVWGRSTVVEVSSLSRLPLNERQQNDGMEVSNIVYIRDLVVDATGVFVVTAVSCRHVEESRTLVFFLFLQEANDECVGEQGVGSELKSLKDNGFPHDCQLEKHHMTRSVKCLFFFVFLCAFKDYQGRETDNMWPAKATFGWWMAC